MSTILSNYPNGVTTNDLPGWNDFEDPNEPVELSECAYCLELVDPAFETAVLVREFLVREMEVVAGWKVIYYHACCAAELHVARLVSLRTGQWLSGIDVEGMTREQIAEVLQP